MVPVPARWTRGIGEHVRVAALPGLFVLFPAWLQHYTAAHTADRPRLSVAFCADRDPNPNPNPNPNPIRNQPRVPQPCPTGLACRPPTGAYASEAPGSSHVH